MTERTRDFLKPSFKDGERPSGANFADLIDSFVNKAADGVKIDSEGNLVLNRGVQLGDSASTVAGGLRVNKDQLQVRTVSDWVNVASGGGGGFQAPPTTPQSPVAHDGNVGIGSFVAAAPTFRLEVPLGSTGKAADQVRFGNVVCSNGAGLNDEDFAVFAHQKCAATDLNHDFALRQSPSGEVHLNARANQIVSIHQGGTSARLGISITGNVIVDGETDLIDNKDPKNPNVFIKLQVRGGAFKNDGSPNWAITSDARVKEGVHDLELGLAELRQVRPVRFRYNGRAGTPVGQAGVGVLGQEIETIVPETIQRVSVPDDPGLNEMRVFDPAALTYVLINAVKELAVKVEQLEQALAAATAPTAGPRPVVA